MQPSCFATLAGGSDCVIPVRADPAVARGCIEMDAVMQRNLHLCAGEPYSFRRAPKTPFTPCQMQAHPVPESVPTRQSLMLDE